MGGGSRRRWRGEGKSERGRPREVEVEGERDSVKRVASPPPHKTRSLIKCLSFHAPLRRLSETACFSLVARV